MSRERVVALLVVVLAVVVIGCGGDDSDSGTAGSGDNDAAEQDESTPAEDEAAVREVAERNLDAIFGDDPATACDDYTEKYQQQVIDDAKSGDLGLEGDSCEAVMVASAALVKEFAPDKPEISEITVDGDRARVLFESSDAEPSVSILVREGDAWLFNDDEESQETGEPTAAEVKQWPTKWCRVQPGMTKQEVIEIMGQPTEQYEGTNPQVTYDAFEYHFTAFFGVDGTVRQLDTNTIQLSEEQIAAIPCEETRVR